MPIINNGNTVLLLVAASATLIRWREKNACFVIHLAACVSCAEECFMKAKRKLIECQFNAVIGVLFLHFLRSGVQSNRNVIDRNMDTKYLSTFAIDSLEIATGIFVCCQRVAFFGGVN